MICSSSSRQRSVALVVAVGRVSRSIAILVLGLALASCARSDGDDAAPGDRDFAGEVIAGVGVTGSLSPAGIAGITRRPLVKDQKPLLVSDFVYRAGDTAGTWYPLTPSAEDVQRVQIIEATSVMINEGRVDLALPKGVDPRTITKLSVTYAGQTVVLPLR